MANVISTLRPHHLGQLHKSPLEHDLNNFAPEYWTVCWDQHFYLLQKKLQSLLISDFTVLTYLALKNIKTKAKIFIKIKIYWMVKVSTLEMILSQCFSLFTAYISFLWDSSISRYWFKEIQLSCQTPIWSNNCPNTILSQKSVNHFLCIL